MKTNFLILLLLMLMAVSEAALARGNPPPLFDKPVKLDDTGRPLYNSWERYEYERKLRQKRKKNAVVPKPDASGTSSPTPTPSSVIINRPVQDKQNDFTF